MDKIKEIFFAAVCFSLCCVVCSDDQQSPDSLLMVNVIYRHGDRSPADTFPTNPLPEWAWPQGFGQLTQRGMLQHYELGKYLRSRYIDGNPYQLLNASYNRSEVHIRSTDYDRTLMSAYSNLAGLYPPAGAQLWNKDIPWQPIPVHTIPLADDYLLNTDVPCKKYDEYLQAALNGEDIKKEEKENKEFYKFVANKTGIPNLSISDAWDAFDPVFCARQHGLLEPDWVNLTWNGQTIYEKLEQLNSLQFDVENNRPGESRFRGGPLLGVMIKSMQERIKGVLSNRSRIYSAHDSTVSAVLSAMKVFNSVAPPYASCVLVELHKVKSDIIVRILYRNDSNHDAYSLQIPGCALDCPFEEFVRITKDNIPSDWHAECQGAIMPRADGLILLATGIILMSVVIVTIIIFSVIRSQGRRRGYIAYDGLGQKDGRGC